MWQHVSAYIWFQDGAQKRRHHDHHYYNLPCNISNGARSSQQFVDDMTCGRRGPLPAPRLAALDCLRVMRLMEFPVLSESLFDDCISMHGVHRP